MLNGDLIEFQMASGTTLSWETLPEELLWMIFKHSTLKCLLSCMTVNRRWKDIALDYIESHSLWPKLATESMVNKGRTFKRKSVLGFKDILMNSLLWPFVPQAEIKLHHTYPQQDITSIQVLKVVSQHVIGCVRILAWDGTDENIEIPWNTITEVLKAAAQETLIYQAALSRDHRLALANLQKAKFLQKSMILTVDMKTTDVPIRYFDIPNTKLHRGLQSTAKKLDVSENEYMRVSVEHVLYAYGKENPNDPLNCNERLEGNVCYIVTKRHIIWALTWDLKRWDLIPRGRCYGSLLDVPCGINLYNDKVCIVTKLGFILYEDRETMLYQKQNNYNLVPRIEDSSVLVLFSQKGVAISVRNSDQRVKVCQEEGTNVVWLECGDMTCATEHGEVLFMGYKDGSVAICSPHTMTPTNGHLDRLFNVREFDNDIGDPTILAVEVFEDKLSHHLLVAIQHKVLQFLITYPDHIRSYFD